MLSYFLALSVPITLLLLAFGGYLLHDAISHSTPSQVSEVIAGASLLASGLLALLAQVKSGVKWMHAARGYRNRDL